MFINEEAWLPVAICTYQHVKAGVVFYELPRMKCNTGFTRTNMTFVTFTTPHNQSWRYFYQGFNPECPDISEIKMHWMYVRGLCTFRSPGFRFLNKNQNKFHDLFLRIVLLPTQEIWISKCILTQKVLCRNVTRIFYSHFPLSTFASVTWK